MELRYLFLLVTFLILPHKVQSIIIRNSTKETLAVFPAGRDGQFIIPQRFSPCIWWRGGKRPPEAPITLILPNQRINYDAQHSNGLWILDNAKGELGRCSSYLATDITDPGLLTGLEDRRVIEVSIARNISYDQGPSLHYRLRCGKAKSIATAVVASVGTAAGSALPIADLAAERKIKAQQEEVRLVALGVSLDTKAHKALAEERALVQESVAPVSQSVASLTSEPIKE